MRGALVRGRVDELRTVAPAQGPGARHGPALSLSSLHSRWGLEALQTAAVYGGLAKPLG